MDVKPMTINERMMYSAVRIEGRRGAGGEACGTGFFLSHQIEEGPKVRMLVSTRRVVEGLGRGTLHLHRPRATTGHGQVVPTESVPVEVDDFWPRWVPHPDPDVGLCALPYDVVHAAVRSAGRDVYGTFFETHQVIPPDEAITGLDAAEEVQLIGYPAEVWDRGNSFPVFRRGTIATHPRVDYRGRPAVLIDVASPEGCVGCPVVVLSRTTFKEDEKELWPVILLGVLVAGFGGGAGGGPGPGACGRGLAPGGMPLGTVVKSRELLVLAEAVAAKMAPAG